MVLQVAASQPARQIDCDIMRFQHPSMTATDAAQIKKPPVGLLVGAEGLEPPTSRSAVSAGYQVHFLALFLRKLYQTHCFKNFQQGS